MVRLAQLALKQ